MKLTINQIHTETGLDRRTIKKLLATTDPAEATPSGDLYHLRDFITALLESRGGMTAALAKQRLAKLVAETAEVELRNGKLSKQLIDTHDFERRQEPTYLEMKRIVLASSMTEKEKEKLLNELADLHVNPPSANESDPPAVEQPAS